MEKYTGCLSWEPVVKIHVLKPVCCSNDLSIFRRRKNMLDLIVRLKKMAWKYLVKHKHNYIQSYRFGKKSTEKIISIKSRFFCPWFLKLWEIRRQKSKIKTKAVKETNLCMKNCVTKVQHQNTKNWTVILIFTRYRTYLLVCCVIYLNIWWHCAKCTENWQVSWYDLWFRTAHMVRQNNIKRKVRHVH